MPPFTHSPKFGPIVLAAGALLSVAAGFAVYYELTSGNSFLSLLASLTVLSIYTFTVFGIDKAIAKTDGARVSERVLLTLAAMGGLVGAIGGMLLFRHKTRKQSFLLPMAGITLLWVVALGTGAYLWLT